LSRYGSENIKNWTIISGELMKIPTAIRVCEDAIDLC